MVWYRFTGVPCSRAAMRQLICFQLSPGWYSRQPGARCCPPSTLTAGGAVPLGAEKEGEVHLHRPGIDGDGGDLPGGEGLFPLDQPEAVPGAGHQSVDPVQSPPLGSPGALNLDGLPAPHKGEGLAQGGDRGAPFLIRGGLQIGLKGIVGGEAPLLRGVLGQLQPDQRQSFPFSRW